MDYVELAKQATEKPSDFGFWGREDLFVTWGHTGINQHRDSSILDVSNWHSVIKHLESEYGKEFDDNFDTYGASHWAVGWVDQLIVRVYSGTNCKLCGKRIDFRETDELKHYWDWVVIDDENAYAPSVCRESHSLEQYHKPMPFTEDDITDYFKYVVDIAVDLREQYPIFDEMDYSDREYEAELEWADFVVKDILWPTGDFQAAECLSWLNDHGYCSGDNDSDGTPLWDRDDLAIGVFMTHQEDPTEDFWIDWVEENPTWVGKRMREDQHKAGQQELGV